MLSAELLSKEIIDHVMQKEYGDLEKVMADVFLEKECLSIISQILNILPSVAFEAFFLSGVRFIANLEKSDFEKLVALCGGKDIARYNLARFLIVHGGAQKEFMSEIGLAGEWPKARGVIDFSQSKKVVLSSDLDDANGKLYALYGTCLPDLSRLRKLTGGPK